MPQTQKRTLIGPGLLKGTLIATPSGPVAVENLRVGDVVNTHLGETTTIREVAQVYSVNCRNAPQYTPLVIPKDKFGSNLPSADLTVLPSRSFQVNGVWHFANEPGMNLPQSSNLDPEYYDIVLDKNFIDFFYAHNLIMDSWDRLTPNAPRNNPEVTWEVVNGKPTIRALNQYGRPTHTTINLMVERLSHTQL